MPYITLHNPTWPHIPDMTYIPYILHTISHIPYIPCIRWNTISSGRELHEQGLWHFSARICSDSSSPQISTIFVGHCTMENGSLRKSPQNFHNKCAEQYQNPSTPAASWPCWSRRTLRVTWPVSRVCEGKSWLREVVSRDIALCTCMLCCAVDWQA